MFKYDRNTGSVPKVGDNVEVCHTASDMDGLCGRIGGWGDYMKMIALVTLDIPYKHSTSDTAVDLVAMPVVCLRIVV